MLHTSKKLVQELVTSMAVLNLRLPDVMMGINEAQSDDLVSTVDDSYFNER